MNFTKNDIFILDSIKTGDGTSKLKALPINTIISRSHLSHTKVRGTIRMLVSQGFINEGYMQKNAKTYFITKDGENFLNEVKGCSEK